MRQNPISELFLFGVSFGFLGASFKSVSLGLFGQSKILFQVKFVSEVTLRPL